MSIAAADFEFISALVRREAAIVLETGKEYLVESRLAPVAREAGLATTADLVGALRLPTAVALQRKVIEAMTTHETSFFRDASPFEALQKDVIPAVMGTRARERKIRIWCAAASSGQEPYTIAMNLLQNFPALATWDVRIIATDISRPILEKARSGRYTQLEVNRGLPAPYLLKYFERAGMEWQINAAVRKLVQFDEMNLLRPWHGLADVDIVFMRNVLIYFDVETRREILARVRRVMRPDGFLFMGSAETTMNIDSAFNRVQSGKASFYRLTGG